MRRFPPIFTSVLALALNLLLAAAMPGKSMASLQLKSSAFSNGGAIPPKFTCDGRDVSPALSWNEPPPGTNAFALIVDDPMPRVVPGCIGFSTTSPPVLGNCRRACRRRKIWRLGLDRARMISNESDTVVRVPRGEQLIGIPSDYTPLINPHDFPRALQRVISRAP
jgi:hypothetical protein